MSRTQIEFITPKCSRLLYGMFQELFEQIINIFLPKELPQSDFVLFISLFASFYSFISFLRNPKTMVSVEEGIKMHLEF